jgi:hypothetical protein
MSIEHTIMKAIEEKSMPLNQLVNEVCEDNNRNIQEVSKNIYLLMEDGKLKLIDPSPPETPLGYLLSVYCLWFWGLFIALIFTFLTIFVFPQIPPLTYVRIGLGFLTALYLPGMALIEALYPKKEDLEETERFASSINKVLNRGGSVLVPVFALGKLQEILALIWKQMQNNKITNVDIYTGGIGKKINRVYDYNRFVVKRNEQELVLHDIPYKDLNREENFQRLFTLPSIVLASSGMMVESTKSFELAKTWLRKKDFAIFTVGYMDPSTPGFLIANSKRGDKIQLTDRDRKLEVKCDIKNFRFSAHSNREELLSILYSLQAEKIILVHGNSEAIDWMGASILKRWKKKKVYAAENGTPLLFD